MSTSGYAKIAGDVKRDAYLLAFQKSPIFLTGGIAKGIPGGVLPIAFLELWGFGVNILDAAASGANAMLNSLQWTSFVFDFAIQPGQELVSFRPATYPLASGDVAANALISQPLSLSVRMTATAGDANKTRTGRLIALTYLSDKVRDHCSQGGLFHVLTSSGLITNCVLNGPIREVTHDTVAQPALMFQWDFMRPLITASEAQLAINTSIKKMDGGAKVSGWKSVGALLKL